MASEGSGVEMRWRYLQASEIGKQAQTHLGDEQNEHELCEGHTIIHTFE